MHDIKKIDVMEGILDQNDQIAADINKSMSTAGILTINEMGAPGVGKTTTITNLFKHLKSKLYVIEGDIESNLDTKHLNRLGIETHQINTHGECHLDAPMIEHGAEHIGFSEPGILFIENIGNLVCPAEFTIGEHLLMLISAVTEGSDKPYKYPLAFEKADIILLNKVDLLPYIDFDEDFFMKGIRALNKKAPVFKVSGTTGEGFPEVAEWLEKKVNELNYGE